MTFTLPSYILNDGRTGSEVRPQRKPFVPLIFTPQKPNDEFAKIANKYWDELQTQLTELETKLGTSTRIYHELVSIGGEAYRYPQVEI
ncbi:MAG: hypothetical protein AB1422_02905 [bacterium]